MSDKAVGSCGWAPAELKLLPDTALELLSCLFARALDLGMAEHMLEAKVAVLAIKSGLH